MKVLHKCVPHRPSKAGSGKPCETPILWGVLGRGRTGGLRAHRPVSSLVSASSGWQWKWSGRCSSPQTGGCSCPRCWTAFCSEAVKSSSIILTFDSLEATVRASRLFLFTKSQNLHLPALIRHVKKIVPQINWRSGIQY